MSAPTQKKAKKIGAGQLEATETEVFLYEGGEVGEELKSKLTRVRVDPRVRCIPAKAFSSCRNLADVQLNEGLLTIGGMAFVSCSALRSVTVPSTVTTLGQCAFQCCINLIEVQLNDGLEVVGECAFQFCSALRSVTIPSTVTSLGHGAFYDCSNLVEVRLNEGLLTVGRGTFANCSLRSVDIPSTVTMLDTDAFSCCSNLTEVQLKDGLEVIGEQAFEDCTTLQSVTIPSTVKVVAHFRGCSNLSEVILLGGKRLLNHEFLARRLTNDVGLLRPAMIGILIDGGTFHDCPLLTRVKISISWAVSERMERLTPECRVFVEERIINLSRLQLLQDGNVVACFPLVSRESNDEADDDSGTEDGAMFDIQDTNNETARSVHQVLQLISFHELKESSILIELAMWKSRVRGETVKSRGDCRVAIPGPAKSLIMEYCGFTGFLRPAMEGAS